MTAAEKFSCELLLNFLLFPLFFFKLINLFLVDKIILGEKEVRIYCFLETNSKSFCLSGF